MERNSQRIKCADLFDYAIAAGLTCTVLRHKSSKQSIPNDQDAAIISIQILWVDGVMDPMVRRRIEKKFNRRPQSPDGLGVKPKLVDQADAHLKKDELGRKTDDGEGHP